MTRRSFRGSTFSQNIQPSIGEENIAYVHLPSDGWIVEEVVKGVKYLLFPDVMIARHGTVSKENRTTLSRLRLIVHGWHDPDEVQFDPSLSMPYISENMRSDKEPLSAHPRPLLSLSFHHNEAESHPTPLIASRICSRSARWGERIRSRGDIQYLSGFCEWMTEVYEGLAARQETKIFSHFMEPACFEYCRPDSMYRALCELWCPETNSFVTSDGEISISIFEISLISGCPLGGNYYEESVVDLQRMMESPESRICLLLYRAYAILAATRHSDRIRHSDWMEFWYRGDFRFPNPLRSHIVRNAKVKRASDIKRPLLVYKGEKCSQYGKMDPFDLLNVRKGSKEGKAVYEAACIVLFLCRFALPQSGDLIRPGTFVSAARIVTGFHYNFTSAILCSLYKGLSRTYTSLSTLSSARGEIGQATSYCPLHYLYGWIGLHFRKGVYGIVKSKSRFPFLPSIAGALNAYIDWEPSFIEPRALLRRTNETCFDFCPRRSIMNFGEVSLLDDQDMPLDAFHFSISCRPGYLIYRRGDVIDVESYNPHRFARQHGFGQDTPGTPILLIDPVGPSRAIQFFMALFRRNGLSWFTPPGSLTGSKNAPSIEYDRWLREKIRPMLANFSIEILLDSEKASFEYNKSEGIRDRQRINPGPLRFRSPQTSKSGDVGITTKDQQSSSHIAGDGDVPKVFTGKRKRLAKRCLQVQAAPSVLSEPTPLINAPPVTTSDLIPKDVSSQGIALEVVSDGESVSGAVDEVDEVPSAKRMVSPEHMSSLGLPIPLDDLENIGFDNWDGGHDFSMLRDFMENNHHDNDAEGASKAAADMTEAESQAVHVEIQLDASEPVEEISPEFSVVTKNNSCTREDFERSAAPVMLRLCRQFIAATLEPYLHAGFTALKNWWSSTGIFFCERLQKFDVDDHAFATHIESFLSDCDAYHTARATLTMNSVSDTDSQLSSFGEEIRSFTEGRDVAMSELAVAKSKLDTAKSEEVAARIIFEEAQAHVTAASNIVSMKDKALNAWDIALTDKQDKQDHLQQLKEARVTDIRNVDVRRKELMQRLQNFSSIY